MCEQVRLVIKDRLLLELLVTWLSPAAAPAETVLPCPVIAIENARPWSPRPNRKAVAACKTEKAAPGGKLVTVTPLAPGCCRVKLGLPPGECGLADVEGAGDGAEAKGGTRTPLQVSTCFVWGGETAPRKEFPLFRFPLSLTQERCV